MEYHVLLEEFPSSPKIWVTDAESDERRLLTKGRDAFFSKDGRRVFFSTEASSSSPLAVINIDGTGKKTLPIPEGTKSPAALSHDGKTLAVVSCTGLDYGLYVVDLDEGDSVRRVDRAGADPGSR